MGLRNIRDTLKAKQSLVVGRIAIVDIKDLVRKQEVVVDISQSYLYNIYDYNF
jgi:hypothetical protein